MDIDDFMAEHWTILEEEERQMKDRADKDLVDV
jgi:hypothetical protein